MMRYEIINHKAEGMWVLREASTCRLVGSFPDKATAMAVEYLLNRDEDRGLEMIRELREAV